MPKKTSTQTRYVDRVIADLQAKMAISKRAPKATKQPWLDTATDPPTMRRYLSGWYSAEELREAADVLDGRPPGS